MTTKIALLIIAFTKLRIPPRIASLYTQTRFEADSELVILR